MRAGECPSFCLIVITCSSRTDKLWSTWSAYLVVLLLIGVLACSLFSCQALYDHTDEVYDLSPDNFQKLVIDSHFVWIVEFYAPWCVPNKCNFSDVVWFKLIAI